MNINKKLTSLLSIAIVVAASAAFIFNSVKAGSLLTAEQANKLVLSEHAGQIMETKLEGSDYIVKMETVHGIYQFVVSQHQAQIASITQLEHFIANNSQTIDGSTLDVEGEPDTALEQVQGSKLDVDGLNQALVLPNNTDKAENPTIIDVVQQQEDSRDNTSEGTTVKEQAETLTVLLNEQQVKKIALSQVAGEIDDVELKQNDSRMYYLVQIEGDNDQEAIVQIHAVTGKVLSITWDQDDHDKDNKEEDEDEDDEDEDKDEENNVSKTN